MPKNGPLFLIARICASHWKNNTYFAKLGTVMNVQFGRE